MTILARSEYKNLAITATEENGMYTVTACRNGKIVGRHETEDRNEAQEIYSYNAYMMYA